MNRVKQLCAGNLTVRIHGSYEQNNELASRERYVTIG